MLHVASTAPALLADLQIPLIERPVSPIPRMLNQKGRHLFPIPAFSDPCCIPITTASVLIVSSGPAPSIGQFGCGAPDHDRSKTVM
jgi:hypothetical protein